MTSAGPSDPESDATVIARNADESAPARATPDYGQSIDRYVILEPIGEGGMGVVVRAYDPKLHREVALKLIKTRSRRPERVQAAKARLMREAQTMAQLSHPNVVPVFDVGAFGADLFVAMEFVEGDSLRGWLRSESRSVRAIVDAFTQAGEGLLAAHRSGLVHRDLKPGNILVGVDGRVRLVDFGLARASFTEADPSASSAGDGPPSRQEHLTAPLTEAGAVVGTPAYMAPEQHRGRGIDHRSDQYAFCLTLYEAIYGRRPFDAKSTAALARQKDRGPPSPGKRKGVPRWLVALMQRGLQPDPLARWPSMAELVAVLHRRRPKPSRRAALAGAIVLVVAALWALGVGDTQPCEGLAHERDSVWNEARRDALAAAFADTGVSYAPEAWSRTESIVEAYFASWLDARTSACEATWVRREQSEARLRAQIECLDAGRRLAGATIDALASPTTTAIARATIATGELPNPQRCVGPNPPDVTRRTEANATLVDELTRVQARYALGEGTEALVVAARIDEDARVLVDDALQAQTALMRGALLLRGARFEPALQFLTRAYFLAGRNDHDEVAARAALELAVTHARLARFELASDWIAHAQMRVERGKLEPLIAAQALDRAASVLSLAGDSAAALDRSRAALALAETELGADHPDAALIAGHVAAHLLDLDRHEEADVVFADAIDRLRMALGSGHPDVAKAMVNASNLDRALGRREQARTRCEHAVAALRATLGPQHPDVATAMMNLSLVYADEGEHEVAQALLREVLELRELALGPEHPDVAEVLVNLGLSLGNDGEGKASVALLERAVEIDTRALGPEHPATTRARMVLKHQE